MSYTALLTHLVNVTRTSMTADGMGGYTSTESTIYRRLSARFNAMSARELSIYADKLGTLAGFTVFLESHRHGPMLKEGDLLVKVDDGRKFDVLLVKNWDEHDRFLTLVCAERARKVE